MRGCLREVRDGEQGLLDAAGRLRPDHGGNSLPHARPSQAAAAIHLAGIRSCPALSAAEAIPGFLATRIGRSAAFGAGGASSPAEAVGMDLRGRRVPPALRPGQRPGILLLTCSPQWVTALLKPSG